MTAPLGAPKLRVVADESLAPPARRSVPVVKSVRGASTYNSYPAVGLTADMLVSLYRQADRGFPVRQFDAFDQLIEVDGHLRGLIDGRIESVAGCEWVLKPGRADKPSELAAAMLEEQLRNGVCFREFIEHHLTAPYYGIACTNLVWDLVDRAIVPVDLVNVAHRRFAAPSAERADEVWLVNGLSNLELIDLEPGLWSVSKFRGRNPWASGLMRTAAWWAMFKRWSIRDWQVFAEMFGLPLAIGYYEEGASDAARAALLDAIKMIGEDGFAVLSAMTEIVIKDTARSGDSSTVYPKIADMCEAQQSKLIAGGTLNTDIGAKGSYAAGTIHADRAYVKSRADARRVDEMFTSSIGRPFIVWNGLDRAAPPRLKIQITRDTLERAQVLEIIGQAVELDTDQIREEFTLRTPAPGKGVKFPTKDMTGISQKGTPDGV